MLVLFGTPCDSTDYHTWCEWWNTGRRPAFAQTHSKLLPQWLLLFDLVALCSVEMLKMFQRRYMRFLTCEHVLQFRSFQKWPELRYKRVSSIGLGRVANQHCSLIHVRWHVAKRRNKRVWKSACKNTHVTKIIYKYICVHMYVHKYNLFIIQYNN